MVILNNFNTLSCYTGIVSNIKQDEEVLTRNILAAVAFSGISGGIGFLQGFV